MSLSAIEKKAYERTKLIVCIYLFSFHTATDKINLFRNFWLVSIASKTFYFARYLNHPKIQHLSFLHQTNQVARETSKPKQKTCFAWLDNNKQ